MNRFKDFIIIVYKNRVFAITSILVSLILLFYFFTPGHVFVDKRNIFVMLKVVPEIGLVALGVASLMICQEFDLSVGSVLALCSVVMAQLTQFGLNVFVAFFIVIVLGAILGVINGYVTVKFKIPSFITTLSTMMIWRGVVLVITEGFSVVFRPQEKSTFFSNIIQGEIGNNFSIPVQIIWLVLIAIIILIFFENHKFGKWVYAVGGNREAARAMGINTDKIKIICFVIVGVLCAISSVFQATRVQAAYPNQAQGMELKAIAAAVIGGISLSGGKGSVIGAFIGVFVIQVIDNGLVTLRVPEFWLQTLIGFLILISVILNKFVEGKIEK